ncbi:MAG: Arylsulfatase [candidate division BRC1 bacterium ADurb.BinA364]|nr:MAG: Arylsulfatase [candidate division BRC1 bacterium ADurb.BinA364]
MFSTQLRRIVCPCLAATAFAAFAGADASSEAPRRPNFVFFLVDDLGCMDVGAYNPNTFYETPNVDRLASQGVRFTQGYAANPVCSPTRYSIMTGKHPTRGGITNFIPGKREGRFLPAPLEDRMALEEVSLAKALKEGGYRSAFVGKWHLGPTEEFWPLAHGFDVNIGGCDRGAPKSYFSPYGNPALEDGPKGEYLTERLGREAAAQIEAMKDGPFLLYLSFYVVHTPLRAPADLVAKYEAKAAAIQGEEFAEEEQVWESADRRQVRILQKHPVYAAMVESMDTQVGRVLAKLDELGLAESTVVFFMSDNGGLSTSEGLPTSNLPLRGGKGWLYEGGIREPFIVRMPGAALNGQTCDAPVVSMDFYPTMLELAGLAPRPEWHMDGASLAPLLQGRGEPPRDALFWHYPHYSNQGGFPGGAIRQGDWKLIERYEDGRVHLFNLKDDPGERRDLASANPERVEAMRARLHAWYKETGAKFLEPKEGGPAPWRP